VLATSDPDLDWSAPMSNYDFLIHAVHVGSSPMNQLVVADILRNRLDAASTIAFGILDLRADLRARLAKPLGAPDGYVAR
jgi:hypothetical protein